MRAFEQTTIAQLTPDEYSRQAHLLLPLQRRHMAQLFLSGVANEIFSVGIPMYGPASPTRVNEGTIMKVCRNKWSNLPHGSKEDLTPKLTDPPRSLAHDDVLFINRTDVTLATPVLRMSKGYIFAVGIASQVGTNRVLTPLGTVSESAVAAVADCCAELDGARLEHRLSMLCEETLEEAWNVPNAPTDWRPLDWV